MSSTNFIVPEDVINKQEYIKWIALKKHSVLTNPYYTTSEGETINISMLPHMLAQRIKKLAPKEQEVVLSMKAKWNNINMRCNDAKAQAYGKKGRYKRNKDAVSVLTDLEHDIIELLGRLFTTNEIVEIMSKDYDTLVNPDDIKEIMKKHVVEIERRREEFRNKVVDVRLYNKRPRLEELSWMYSKAKNRYMSLQTNETYMAMLRTLEQIRKESEGDILNIRGSLEINVEVEIQNQIQQEMMRTVNLKEVILGRTAARMNYDVGKLISSLHNSYYAKFITISGDFDPEAQMDYPSQQNYDFNKIQKDAATDAVTIEPDKISDTEKNNADNVREMFKKRLNKQKQELESRRDILNNVATRDYDPEAETELVRDKRKQEHKLKKKK